VAGGARRGGVILGRGGRAGRASRGPLNADVRHEDLLD
jgi:hypothetical protein